MFPLESPVPGLPPDQVRIQKAEVEPWPDGQRIRVHLDLTPFEKRPSLELGVYDPQGQEVASAVILETMIPRIVVTMHIRPLAPSIEFQLRASLFYDDLGVIHQVERTFQLPAEPDPSE